MAALDPGHEPDWASGAARDSRIHAVEVAVAGGPELPSAGGAADLKALAGRLARLGLKIAMLRWRDAVCADWPTLPPRPRAEFAANLVHALATARTVGARALTLEAGSLGLSAEWPLAEALQECLCRLLPLRYAAEASGIELIIDLPETVAIAGPHEIADFIDEVNSSAVRWGFRPPAAFPPHEGSTWMDILDYRIGACYLDAPGATTLQAWLQDELCRREWNVPIVIPWRVAP